MLLLSKPDPKRRPLIRTLAVGGGPRGVLPIPRLPGRVVMRRLDRVEHGLRIVRRSFGELVAKARPDQIGLS
jgi:hypothetical protein